MISKLFSRSIVPVALVIGLVAGAAGIAASEGMAHHGHMMHRGMHSMGLRLMLKSANLTDAQKAQVHKIFSSRRTTMAPQIEQLKAARLALAQKFTTPGPLTASDVAPQVSQITQLKNQIAQERLEDAIAVRNLLTPAQLQKVAQTRAKLDQIHSEMKGLWSKGDKTTPTE